MNGVIWFRADHDLVGRVIAEKHRRRLDRNRPIEEEGSRLKAVRASGRVG